MISFKYCPLLNIALSVHYLFYIRNLSFRLYIFFHILFLHLFFLTTLLLLSPVSLSLHFSLPQIFTFFLPLSFSHTFNSPSQQHYISQPFFTREHFPLTFSLLIPPSISLTSLSPSFIIFLQTLRSTWLPVEGVEKVEEGREGGGGGRG